MKKINIPQTDSIEELAHFWDTHDLTEFEGQLEEVSEPVFERSPEAVVTLRLQPREIAAVKQAAQERGMEEAMLLREWVLEKLHSIDTAS